MIKAIGYAAKSSSSKLKPFEFTRQDPKADEVQIEVLYCGVCHSDVHQARNEWMNTNYPCLPGHEIIGRVVNAGAQVKKFKVGDSVGVGCMINSCQKCENCKQGLENYCEKGATATYNGNMKEPQKSKNTFGGYSNTLVVREDFVLEIPKSLDLAAAAPLLCAGVTTYSPLKYWKVGKGTQVAIVGFGGLGHVATKIAIAMGAEVSVITTNAKKRNHAKKLGAKKIIISTDKKAMEKNEKSFDFILSTIPETHDINPYMSLLKTNGTLTIVGCLAPLKKPLDMSEAIMERRSLGSSLIGGIPETQEVLNFCAQHKIMADIQLIPIEEVNDAFDALDAKKADFRYVIEMNSLSGKHEDKGLLAKIGL